MLGLAKIIKFRMLLKFRFSSKKPLESSQYLSTIRTIQPVCAKIAIEKPIFGSIESWRLYYFGFIVEIIWTDYTIFMDWKELSNNEHLHKFLKNI